MIGTSVMNELNALREAFENRATNKISIEELVKMAKFGLKNYYFEFDKKVFLNKFLEQRQVLNFPQLNLYLHKPSWQNIYSHAKLFPHLWLK